MRHILLIEDDESLGGVIRTKLEKKGYRVHWLTTLAQGLSVSPNDYDLALVDWSLNDGDGIELVQKWNGTRIHLPVIVLTAHLSLDYRVEAARYGADDFLGKPFHFHELLGRIEFLFRKKHPGHKGSNSQALSEQELHAGGIRLDLVSQRAFSGEQEVSLKPTEFALLKFFLMNPGRVFTREEILDRVWDPFESPTTRTVDTHISQLRKTFGAEKIETVWGTGYRFRLGDGSEP